eukprot:1123373-Prorocentrum_minimum.AAC.1
MYLLFGFSGTGQAPEENYPALTGGWSCLPDVWAAGVPAGEPRGQSKGGRATSAAALAPLPFGLHVAIRNMGAYPPLGSRPLKCGGMGGILDGYVWLLVGEKGGL